MSQTYGITPGTVIGVPAVWEGFEVEHVGILTDLFVHNERTVVSSSKRRGGVVEETLVRFLDGRSGRVIGYLGTLPPRVVVARARAHIGREWSILDNCEHFVRRVHGLVPASPQLESALATLGLRGRPRRTHVLRW
jgi:hypothetical protein